MVDFSKVISGLFRPITDAYKSNQERKKAKESAEAKLSLAKQDGNYRLELTDKEWEALSKSKEDSTWKDEYVTILITSPYILVIMGSLISSFTEDMRYIESVNFAMQNLKELGIPIGDLTLYVVLAAIGIKATNFIRK